MSVTMITPQAKRQPEGGLLSLLSAFFRHHQLFLGAMCFTFVIVLGVALVTKKQYRSEMKYLVQNARSTALISSDHASSSIVNEVTEEELNSELAILQSEDVLSQVADPHWNPEDAKNKSAKEARAHSKKLTKLVSHLTVDPIGKEDVMSVSYLADSPQEATDVMSAISAAYLARHEQLRRPTGASSFFVEQAKQYEGEWKTAQQQLVDFRQLHHLVSVPDVEESLQRSILSDQEALRANQLKLRQSSASLQLGNELLSTVPQRQQTQQRSVPSEALIQQLKGSLVAMNNRRTELLDRYAPTDRLVVELDQQIADTTKAINGEGERQNVENTTDVNPSWQELKTTLVREQVNHEALQGGQTGLEGQIAELNAQLAEAQGLELTFNQLRTRAEEAQANFKAFTEKRDLAHVEDAMDRSKLLNVAVMESPTFSDTPARPKPLLNLALGIPTALFVASAAVYFAESGRMTIGAPAELDRFSDYPVLATIAFEPMFGEGPSSSG